MSFRINRVYTRSGDSGMTKLAGGTAVKKSHPLIGASGDVDELNSLLGLAKEETGGPCRELIPIIAVLQQELFDLGAFLSSPNKDEEVRVFWAERTHELERLCDEYNDAVGELSSFVLPGGSRLSALFHCSRCAARRAERSIVAAVESECGEETRSLISSRILPYINRLSDLLFVLARWSLMREGRAEVLWVPAAERLDRG